MKNETIAKILLGFVYFWFLCILICGYLWIWIGFDSIVTKCFLTSVISFIVTFLAYMHFDNKKYI